MKENTRNYEYLLDAQYFSDIEGDDVHKGNVAVVLAVTKREDIYEMNFHLSGVVVIPCNRCLDCMDMPIDTKARLIAKFGKDYAEESDEIVVIPESEGYINIAWFLYEFVVLAIPIKHVHPQGKCNRQMSAKLRKYAPKTDGYDGQEEDPTFTDSDAEQPVDPRWDALRNFKEE
ncbi:MAG: DUF177 domain-containing protein [Dysgonamonadaceae bacterium]|nr:DUF177 domain-containing protein [Dysgonamonadaceae bacterium]